MRTCLIFNPIARGGKARALREHLDAYSSECTLRPTTCGGDARRLAAEAVEQGFETIVAAGGDGTVNEVVNGIADVPGGFGRARLGVMPLGTVNVFARELGLPLKLEAAWQVIRRGKEMTIDLPRAEFTLEGSRQQRYFIQLGGAGLDSRAIELVSWKLKTRIGPLAYVYAGLKALGEPHPLITVEACSETGIATGQSHSGELVLMGNGRYYGGSFPVFPRAELTNGRLEATIFPKVSWSKVLGIGWGILRGPLKGVHEISAPCVMLKSPQRVLLELDGENVGELPVKIVVSPRVLRVIIL